MFPFVLFFDFTASPLTFSQHKRFHWEEQKKPLEIKIRKILGAAGKDWRETMDYPKKTGDCVAAIMVQIDNPSHQTI